MPIERHLDSDARVLRTTLSGAITIEELRQHVDAVHALGWDQYCEIIDAREAEPRFSPKELPILAAQGRRLFGNREMAPRAVIVSDSDLMSFGIARLFGTLVAPWVTVRVFDNVPAATAFIDSITALPN